MHTLTDTRPGSSAPGPRAQSGGLRLLTPEHYDRWDALVDASPQGSVFCRSWWLKATEGGVNVLGYFDGGRLVAGIPLHYDTRLMMKCCTMPKLAQTWGVVIEPLKGKYTSRLSREIEILTAFATELRKEFFFYQRFHPNLTNWLAFHWNGFRQSSRATYTLTDLTNTQQLWDNMSNKTRNLIRKAVKLGIRVRPCGVDAVFTAVTKVFARQRMEIPYSRSLVEKIYSAGLENNGGECFCAADAEGKLHAAILLVWDKNRAYYLAGGADPELRASGAQSALLWHCIQFASERSAVFDFEGSMVEPIEQFFRDFGAKQVPYHQIVRMPAAVSMFLDRIGKL
jgi:hypothetical protein